MMFAHPSSPRTHLWLVLFICLGPALVTASRAQSVSPSEPDPGGHFPPEPVDEMVPAAQFASDTAYRSPSMDRAPVWHEMVTNLPRDWARSFGMTFSASSLPTLLGISAVTTAFLLTDHSTCQASRSLYSHSPFARQASNEFVLLGDGRSQFILAGAFAAYGFLASDRRALRTASQTIEAVLACGLVVQTLKHISGRESPEGATSHTGTWRPFPNLKEYQQHQIKYYAFPSGHIATAMAAVTVVADNYAEIGWLRPVGYGIVGLIGASLVNKGYHWYSDLPLGIAIGHTFGFISSHPSIPEAPGPSEGRSVRFRVSPVVGPNGSAVSLAMLF